MTTKPIRRCAIYTRKSSEEGLEQDFNSLQAQREACEAFIASQRSEGWKLVPTAYDDGGLSGGNMERPGLLKLLADIASGLVDVVVVYKVDRLTRSLADFAKIVEVFDKRGASFVAVTQQFNTTTSMGRLTLNVLLSFAQFEREVTGERIRDKIAASKAKGMWMGGYAPLGYAAQNRKLIVVPEEAEQVREIFRGYLASTSTHAYLKELKAKGIVSRARNGKPGFHFRRGALYCLLSNPIYLGKIRHKGTVYEGQHPAIVDEAVWAEVQLKMKRPARQNDADRKSEPSPLRGKLFDGKGRPMYADYSSKNGRQHRYYVSKLLPDEENSDRWRLPARQIEDRVRETLQKALTDQSAIVIAAQEAGVPASELGKVLQTATHISTLSAIDRVDLLSNELRIHFCIDHQPTVRVTYVMPVEMRRRGVESKLVIPGTPEKDDPGILTLRAAISRAMKWWERLLQDDTLTAADLGREEGIGPRYVQRLLPLAMLSPEVVESVSKSFSVAGLNVESTIRGVVTANWHSSDG